MGAQKRSEASPNKGSGAPMDLLDDAEDVELDFPESDGRLFIQNNIRVAQENGYSSLPAS